MRCLLCRQKRGIGNQREVNAGEALNIIIMNTRERWRRKEEKTQLTHRTGLVWNLFKSTLREPSKRRDAVMDETTCVINRFRFVGPH